MVNSPPVNEFQDGKAKADRVKTVVSDPLRAPTAARATYEKSQRLQDQKHCKEAVSFSRSSEVMKSWYSSIRTSGRKCLRACWRAAGPLVASVALWRILLLWNVVALLNGSRLKDSLHSVG